MTLSQDVAEKVASATNLTPLSRTKLRPDARFTSVAFQNRQFYPSPTPPRDFLSFFYDFKATC
jgi:hypothetical protein